jgi:hypothetical protein
MTRITALLAALALALVACGDGGDPGTDPGDNGTATNGAATDGYDVADQPDAAVIFVSPMDGDTVSTTFTVELAATGVTLTEVGPPAVGEGHLHVMANIGCFEPGEVIPGPSPDDEAAGIFHLGDGSESREITLEPGAYELCVQIGDGAHQAFGEPQTITVTVE